MQAGEKYPFVDSEQVSVDLSGLRPGTPELRIGHALETESGGRGMEDAPSNCELHVASVWRSGSGPTHVEHDYALPAMGLPIPPITPGTGRSSPEQVCMLFLRSGLFQQCYPEHGQKKWSDHGGPLNRGLRN